MNEGCRERLDLRPKGRDSSLRGEIFKVGAGLSTDLSMLLSNPRTIL